MNLKRIIQCCLLLVVLISSVLLSLSIGDFTLFIVAMSCAVTSFIVTDILKVFKVQGWLANVTSIAILVFAMKDFFYVDSSGKLLAVANLLVYLQSILMFQEKTPRLNWQILVLSLLQVVITTIFSIGFENSYLLLVYFAVAGATMVFQCLYTETEDINCRNRKSGNRLSVLLDPGKLGFLADRKINQESVAADTTPARVPLTFYENPGYRRKTIMLAMSQMVFWVFASLFFTTIMFLMAPRNSRPLIQPLSYEVAATGFSNEVNLNEKGKIQQSNAVIFRAKLFDYRSGQPIRFATAPYFRGMALSKLEITDGHTNWRAPFDRVDDSGDFYRSILNLSPDIESQVVKQVITLQQTSNPTIYGISPVYATTNTPGKIRYCEEISVFTRARLGGTVAMAPFKYELATLKPSKVGALQAWPYQSTLYDNSRQEMLPDSIQHQSLTEIDRRRYPGLVAVADRLAKEVKAEGGSRKDILKKFTDYFSSNGYKYTLDFRSVDRDQSVDAVADFFSNHKSGHCELYASALTLMLRSQNIPARLVVGFLANDYHQYTESYVVRGKHAHAWVEAYLPRRDCGIKMIKDGFASHAGAWAIADPNPAEVLVGSESSNDPIELARTVWQDMVLGVEASNRKQSDADSYLIFKLISATRSSSIGAVTSMRRLSQNKGAQLIATIAALMILLVFLYGRSQKRLPMNDRRRQNQKVGVLRRLMASAVGLLSPKLESWMLAARSETQFYRHLESILEGQNLQRASTQTHREFARIAQQKFRRHPESETIGRVIAHTTDLFNQVRFGQRDLTETERTDIWQWLDQLKTILQRT